MISEQTITDFIYREAELLDTMQWQAWLDLRNLTDKRYAATVTPGYDDKGADVARHGGKRSTPYLGRLSP